MGDADPVSDAHTLDRRGSGRPAVRTGKPPRNLGMRGESERRGLAGCVVTKGLLSKVVEPAGLNITLELAVPSRPVVFQKPGAKLRKLLWGERLDFLLGFLYLAHSPQPVA